ncbi:MAG: hypothetical protein GC182_07020 [Rhodopseudomonas sp.]|nr:hypothetical protein [Rhodopseudomonas sp.]
MQQVTERQKSEFRELGYTVVENLIPEPKLTELRNELTRLWQRAKRGQVNQIRVYEDYPHMLGGINVAGIEDPFFLSPMLKQWMATAGIDDILAALTGWPGSELELARLHMNDRFKYQGFWHRDATTDRAEHSVVGVVYFRDETGFRIAPAGSQWSAVDKPYGDDIQRQHFFGPLEGELTASAPAGSILFMKSYLLHRGYNNDPRLHLHLRFIDTARTDAASWPEYRNLEAAPYNFGASKPMQRLRNLVGYCLPHKNRSSLFQS